MTIDPLKGFGQNVVDEVNKEYSRNGSLKPLLARLGIKPVAGIHDQKTAIAGFIYQYGVGLLMNVLRSGLGSEQIERQRLNVLSASRNVVARTESVLHSAASTAGAESTAVAVAPCAPGEPMPRTAEFGPSPRMINTPTYKGPDRRVNPDRRSGGPDRRMACELILRRNLRYGGARRVAARRAEDKAKERKS